jgi:hypothetical protein
MSDVNALTSKRNSAIQNLVTVNPQGQIAGEKPLIKAVQALGEMRLKEAAASKHEPFKPYFKLLAALTPPASASASGASQNKGLVEAINELTPTERKTIEGGSMAGLIQAQATDSSLPESQKQIQRATRAIVDSANRLGIEAGKINYQELCKQMSRAEKHFEKGTGDFAVNGKKLSKAEFAKMKEDYAKSGLNFGLKSIASMASEKPTEALKAHLVKDFKVADKDGAWKEYVSAAKQGDLGQVFSLPAVLAGELNEKAEMISSYVSERAASLTRS